jgi:membrane protease YdiL (CAAX protease family)
MHSVPHEAGEPSAAFKYSIVALICAATPPLLAIPALKGVGWLLIAMVTAVLALKWQSRFARHMLVLISSLVLLGLIPINTDIDYFHMFGMGAVLIGTIALPYFVTTNVFKEKVITFPFRFGRKWRRREIFYVFFAGGMSYLILPYYLGTTGSYLNWGVTLDPSHIIRLFIGTNGLGIWDEIFFIGVCLTLLRQHIPFIWANLAQAALWTTFLYELGFRGWGPYAIFFFALTQGMIFKNSKSLLYIITVHLTIDFVLFLVLIHLHHPEYLRIFITSPF